MEDFFSSADELVGPSLFLGLVAAARSPRVGVSEPLWARNPQLLPAAGVPAPKKAELSPDFNLP